MSWLTGWQYRKKHEIVGSTSGAVTDYCIKIVVHYGSGTDSGEHVYLNGKCRTDFGDVRFTSDDGVTLLSYWIEEKVDGDYAVFWVKIPSIPASPDKAIIYIYYGKSDATSISSGDDTFILFDDFSGSTLDPNKWVDVSEGSASAYVDTGLQVLVLHPDGTNRGYVRSLNQISEKNIIVRARAKTLQDGSGHYAQIWILIHWDGEHTGSYDNPDNCYRGGRRHEAFPYVRVQKFVGASSVWYQDASQSVDDEWHIIDFGHYNDKLILNWDNVNKLSVTDTNATEFTTLYIGASGREVYADTYIDWIFVRKFIDPEPTNGDWYPEEEYTPPPPPPPPITPFTPFKRKRAVIQAFSNKAMEQLEIFSDWRDVKIVLNEEVFRDIYSTTVAVVPWDTPSPVKIDEWKEGAMDVRGWYIMANSRTGRAFLRLVPSQTLVFDVDFYSGYIFGNKDVFTFGEYGDVLMLYFSDLEPYSKILLQLDLKKVKREPLNLPLRLDISRLDITRLG